MYDTLLHLCQERAKLERYRKITPSRAMISNTSQQKDEPSKKPMDNNT